MKLIEAMYYIFTYVLITDFFYIFLLMQVKGQANTAQKTQQIQLQQLQQSVQSGSIPQQILLRPTGTGQTHIQGNYY